MRIAILIKQIPAVEAMELGPEGRLVRDAVRLEMNAYCRRAVSLGVELAKADEESTTTVFTLGPLSALDVIREAVGWGVDEGVLVSDPHFAGSDTVATTKALTAAVAHRGTFDLILVGRNSLDADTGQVGPGIAELFGWSFLPSVKEFSLDGEIVTALCEEDDGETERVAALPLVVACAERLIEPCKVKPDGWPELGDPRITTVGAAAIGVGPWGAAASPTTVGEIRVHESKREQVTLEGPPSETVTTAVSLLERRGAFDVPKEHDAHDSDVEQLRGTSTRRIGVVVEPDRPA
ncbi:MAG TPA: hypothetical protein VG368_06790, partial [Acidimicrobiales bacterium]|nr:hypothetical protein [Acidimicrobiales bacterium]